MVNKLIQHHLHGSDSNLRLMVLAISYQFANMSLNYTEFYQSSAAL